LMAPNIQTLCLMFCCCSGYGPKIWFPTICTPCFSRWDRAGTLVSSSDEDDNRSIGQEVLNSSEETAKERDVQNVRMPLEMGDAAKRIVETAS
jgi:hypothetical protein